MKITKIIVATLAAFVVNSVSFAGELTVTGTAKATYSIRSNDSTTSISDNGKGIGIANEFSLGASGETDNGISWVYAQDIDGATVQDDAKLTLTHSTFGTLGIFVSEGGISSKYKWDVSAYAPGSDYGWTGNSAVSHSASASVAGFTNGDDIGGFNNIQYHSPAGFLPKDLSIKLAYAPDLGTNANASSGAVGTAVTTLEQGNDATQIQVSFAPVEGATLSTSYIKKENQNVIKRHYEAGGIAGKYSFGPVSAGYAHFRIQPALEGAQSAIYTDHYVNDAYGISLNVNDALSVSFTHEKSEANKETVVDAEVDTTVEAEITAIQAAYTMGGMTLSLASKEMENMDYTTGLDGNETTFAIVMAF